MLESCKTASVKTLTSENAIYVKAMIKKSYGEDLRPAFLLFDGFNPEKRHCSTPVGASGLCCHILAHLLFLKHYNDANEKILALSCTEQLQKYHR